MEEKETEQRNEINVTTKRQRQTGTTFVYVCVYTRISTYTLYKIGVYSRIYV